jgi:hypothetical protein
MADKKSKGKSTAKGKSAAKGKDKSAKGKDGAASDDVLRVAGHPVAARSVRVMKGWGGVLAFVVTFWLSWSLGVPFYWSALRAVLAGAIGYVVVWTCAVTFWRHMLVAQVEAARMKAMGVGPGSAEPKP